MTEVVAFPGSKQPQLPGMGRDPAYDRFVLARREMVHALRTWLLTRPDQSAVADELAATCEVGRQLRDLLLGSDVP